MLRRLDQFIYHGILRATYNTDTAAHAFIYVYLSLHFFGSRDFYHIDSAERAPFNTGLAAAALLLVEDRLKAGGGI
jgi:hypothetical protein